MRLVAILIMAFVLLFGCTNQTTIEEQPGEARQPEAEELSQPEETESSLPDTSKLVFTREQLLNYTPGPGVPLFNFSNITDYEDRLIVYYFYSSGCIASKAIGPEIDKLEANYPETIFLRYNLSSVNGSWAYKAFAEQYNLSKDQRLVPQVLVNDTIITDRFNINESLEGIIASFSYSG